MVTGRSSSRDFHHPPPSRNQWLPACCVFRVGFRFSRLGAVGYNRRKLADNEHKDHSPDPTRAGDAFILEGPLAEADARQREREKNDE